MELLYPTTPYFESTAKPTIMPDWDTICKEASTSLYHLPIYENIKPYHKCRTSDSEEMTENA